jgi:hypothetical protein
MDLKKPFTPVNRHRLDRAAPVLGGAMCVVVPSTTRKTDEASGNNVTCCLFDEKEFSLADAR